VVRDPEHRSKAPQAHDAQSCYGADRVARKPKQGWIGWTWSRGLLVLLCILGAASPAFAADEIHWTIIGQTAVTFDWRETSQDMGNNTIRYGTARGVYGPPVTAVPPTPSPDSSAGPFWEARLTGLDPDTLYYYRIANEPESEPPRTFRTPPLRGTSDFWIAEEADIGSTLNYSAVGPTQVQIAQDHPDIPGDDRPRFVLVPGDLTYGDDKGLPAVDRHFNDVMVWSQDAAYMPIWGNHDWLDLPGDAGKFPDDLQNYKGRFDFPNSQTSPPPAPGGTGEDWYWFDYGNVRFIAYPEPYTSGTGGTFADWESKADPVMAAAQADPAITFILTFGHRPAYSTGFHSTYKPDGTLSDPAKHLVGIFDRLRSKYTKYVLNINAHSHNYERTCPIKGVPPNVLPTELCTTADQGLVHITGAGGGGTPEDLEAVQPWTVYRTQHLEHMKIHFTATKIEGFVVCGPATSDDGVGDSCTQGAIIDWWVIQAPGPLDLTPPARAQGLRIRN
jgi:hypothetical protein